MNNMKLLFNFLKSNLLPSLGNMNTRFASPISAKEAVDFCSTLSLGSVFYFVIDASVVSFASLFYLTFYDFYVLLTL